MFQRPTPRKDTWRSIKASPERRNVSARAGTVPSTTT